MTSRDWAVLRQDLTTIMASAGLEREMTFGEALDSLEKRRDEARGMPEPELPWAYRPGNKVAGKFMRDMDASEEIRRRNLEEFGDADIS